MSVPTLLYPIELIKRKIKPLLKFFRLNNIHSKVGAPAKLPNEDAICFGLYKQQNGIPTKKSVWRTFLPVIPDVSYKVFVESLNRCSKIILALLLCILKVNRKSQHIVKHLDSTAIPVCRNKNAKHHKTMKGLAAWGKTGDGWFYGLKLHLISDLLDKLQSALFTPGNVSDKDTGTVLKLAKEITGIVIADAGYVSKKLAEAFNRLDRILKAKPYRNMKVLATTLDGLLYGTRMMIEKHFRCLKLFFGLITSVPRSVTGYFGNYFYALTAYQLSFISQPRLP
jgi:hypothetical protein